MDTHVKLKLLSSVFNLKFCAIFSSFHDYIIKFNYVQNMVKNRRNKEKKIDYSIFNPKQHLISSLPSPQAESVQRNPIYSSF